MSINIPSSIIVEFVKNVYLLNTSNDDSFIRIYTKENIVTLVFKNEIFCYSEKHFLEHEFAIDIQIRMIDLSVYLSNSSKELVLEIFKNKKVAKIYKSDFLYEINIVDNSEYNIELDPNYNENNKRITKNIKTIVEQISSSGFNSGNHVQYKGGPDKNYFSISDGYHMTIVYVDTILISTNDFVIQKNIFDIVSKLKLYNINFHNGRIYFHDSTRSLMVPLVISKVINIDFVISKNSQNYISISTEKLKKILKLYSKIENNDAIKINVRGDKIITYLLGESNATATTTILNQNVSLDRSFIVPLKGLINITSQCLAEIMDVAIPTNNEPIFIAFTKPKRTLNVISQISEI